jgi:hypothetical protein
MMGNLQAETFVGYPIHPENTQISLLTCSPGEQIYELFGHTAIRIKDSTSNVDFVVNYGLFDFNQDNFIYRFVRGKTDYMAGISYTHSFLEGYKKRGSSVTQSILNLTTQEKTDLLNKLDENLKPENREYRYNFIYDNCATRVRDMIETSVKQKISYPTHVDNYTFREALMLYTEQATWSQLGFDLCLGKGADITATQREMFFLPEILGGAYESSRITNNNESYPLTLQTNVLVPKNRETETVWFTPTLCAYALLLLALFASFYLRGKKKYLEIADIVLNTINGLGGCIILFLILFSQHPFTNENYNIIWMNPLTLFPIIACIFPFLKKLNGLYYATTTIMWLAFIILMPILPQTFNTAVLPWVLTLLLRSYLRFSEIKERHQSRNLKI